MRFQCFYVDWFFGRFALPKLKFYQKSDYKNHVKKVRVTLLKKFLKCLNCIYFLYFQSNPNVDEYKLDASGTKNNLQSVLFGLQLFKASKCNVELETYLPTEQRFLGFDMRPKS